MSYSYPLISILMLFDGRCSKRSMKITIATLITLAIVAAIVIPVVILTQKKTTISGKIKRLSYFFS